MFIGHFALGYAAKRLDPRPSLAVYLVAAQLPDVVWPAFVLLGLERVAIAPGDTAFTPLRFESYPYTHSLLMVGLWGAALAFAYRRRGGAGRAPLLLALLAVSHWVLDFVSHRPDMPLAPGGGPKLGLGLWDSVPLTMAVEIPLFAAGVWLYLRATRPRDRVGRLATAALVGLLLVLYLGNAFSPSPPSVAAVAWSALLLTPLVAAWAHWADRHRATP